MIGQQILNYRLIKEIGKGGMATVYEAHHLTFENRKVAIKILDSVLSKDNIITKRFINEAKIIATLEHPNIVKVLDFDSKDRILAIIMELLEGENLKETIAEKLLNKEKKILIFKQILQAIEYGHSKGIIHRDIKPSNIFLVNNLSIAKVLDFGIAKMLNSDNQKTITGISMGTPMFMSPEQVKGLKNIDQKSDIYSLGVLLFFIFSEQTPYDKNDSQYNILTKIVNEPLPDLKGNDNINLIIKKATAKNPAERYLNCSEFLEAFENTNELSGFISVNQDFLEKKENEDKHKKAQQKPIVQNTNTKINNNNSIQEKTEKQSSSKSNIDENKKPSNYLIFSIIVTLICCTPLGIVSLITGSQVEKKIKKGDIQGAKKASKTTRTILIIAVISSAIILIAYLLIQAYYGQYYDGYY